MSQDEEMRRSMNEWARMFSKDNGVREDLFEKCLDRSLLVDVPITVDRSDRGPMLVPSGIGNKQVPITDRSVTLARAMVMLAATTTSYGAGIGDSISAGPGSSGFLGELFPATTEAETDKATLRPKNKPAYREMLGKRKNRW